jgi:replicative DNA helicase
MGKSTLALQIACHAAARQNRRVLFFSLEDTEEALKAKASTTISPELWDTGSLAFETRTFSMREIEAMARERQKTTGLDLIVLDCIQLARHQDFLTDGPAPKEREMSMVSRELKIMAKVLGLPILVLSQVNRGVEFRPNKRPRLADLRESGAMEADSDVVAFLYRDEMYHADSPDCGTAEIIIAKHRGGECGKVRLGFGGKPPRFSNR